MIECYEKMYLQVGKLAFRCDVGGAETEGFILKGKDSEMFEDKLINMAVLVSVSKNHNKATSIKALSHFFTEDEVLASMSCRYKYVCQYVVNRGANVIHIEVKAVLPK